MDRTKEVVSFINEIKEDYLFFLKQTADEFPYCCDTSCQILMSYIAQKFNLGKIQVGYHKKSKTFHVWGEINEFFIDFTFFQFLEDIFTIEDLSYCDNSCELYHELITRYYDDVILSENFKNELFFVQEVPCLFTEMASSFDTFSDYLSEMRKRLWRNNETSDFINRSYDESYKNVVSEMKKAI